MIVVTVIEVLFGVCLLFVVATQVIAPLWRGTLLFPVVRREARLAAERVRVEQALREKDIELEVQAARERLSRKSEEESVRSGVRGYRMAQDAEQAQHAPAGESE